MWIGLDATSKAIISYVVGRRTGDNAYALADDLRARILNAPQISTDALAAYAPAIDSTQNRSDLTRRVATGTKRG